MFDDILSNCELDYHRLTLNIIDIIKINNFDCFDNLVDFLIESEQGFLLACVMRNACFYSEYIKSRSMYQHHVENIKEIEKLKEKYERKEQK